MNGKLVVQIVLLTVVGASVAVWAWKNFAAPPAAAGTQLPADGVAVVNFHGVKR